MNPLGENPCCVSEAGLSRASEVLHAQHMKGRADRQSRYCINIYSMPCKDSSGASRQVATVEHVRGLTEEEIEQWRFPALYVS